MKRLIFALPLLLISCQPAFALDWDVIAKIESSGKWNAIGDSGKSFGLWQINELTITDYNNNALKTGRKAVSRQELVKGDKDTALEKQMAIKAFKQEMDKKTLKRLGFPITDENLIVCWNAGAGALKYKKGIPKSTKAYISKYKKYLK
jgi:hypothetical protein